MQFLKGEDEDVNISLISLIDVIFLLLIFFILTTTLIDPSKTLDLKLPEAKAASPENKSVSVTIEIGAHGAMMLNGKPVKLQSLERGQEKDGHRPGRPAFGLRPSGQGPGDLQGQRIL